MADCPRCKRYGNSVAVEKHERNPEYRTCPECGWSGHLIHLEASNG